MTTILFGANNIAAEVIKKHNKNFAVVDSFQTGELSGLEIQSPHILADSTHFDDIIICTESGFEDVMNFLFMLNIPQEIIFTTDLDYNLIPLSEFLAFRKQHILVTTLPKSGTVWYRTNLYQATKRRYAEYPYNFYRPKFSGEGYFYYENVAESFKNGSVNVEHTMCNEVNITSLRENIEEGLKLIIHFRDPRQGLLSWIHHMEKKMPNGGKGMDILELHGFLNCSDFHEKVDYLIEHFYPKYLLWIGRWKAFIDQVNNDTFLVTRHENLSARPEAFNEAVCEFLGATTSQLRLGAKPKEGKKNFRSGLVEEWKTTFSASAIDKMTAKLKEAELLEFVENFGIYR